MDAATLQEKATPEPPDAASPTRLPPSASYYSSRLDELEVEAEALRIAENALWPLAEHDPLVQKIIIDIEAAMIIRAGAEMSIEGEMRI